MAFGFPYRWPLLRIPAGMSASKWSHSARFRKPWQRRGQAAASPNLPATLTAWNQAKQRELPWAQDANGSRLSTAPPTGPSPLRNAAGPFTHQHLWWLQCDPNSLDERRNTSQSLSQNTWALRLLCLGHRTQVSAVPRSVFCPVRPPRHEGAAVSEEQASARVHVEFGGRLTAAGHARAPGPWAELPGAVSGLQTLTEQGTSGRPHTRSVSVIFNTNVSSIIILKLVR